MTVEIHDTVETKIGPISLTCGNCDCLPKASKPIAGRRAASHSSVKLLSRS